MTAQPQQYKYSTMRFYVLHPHIIRSDFLVMPGLMRPTWDLYWSAIDMTRSPTAKIAVAETYKLFQEHPNGSPDKDKILDVVLLYGKLTTLTTKVAAAIRLVEEGKTKAKVKYYDGRKLYDGTWFDVK